MEIAFSSYAAFGEKNTLSCLLHRELATVSEIANDGSYGQFQNYVIAVMPVAKLAPAVLAVPGFEFLFEAELIEGAQIGNSFAINVAALASGRAGRTQTHHVFVE